MVTKDNFVINGDVKENYIVSSLVRGLQILATFTPKRPALKVSEIAEITGLDQATVFRFVYTLEKLGYLVRDEETKRYHQTVRMLTLSLPARQGVAVREVSLPTMYDLSKAVQEVVTVTVLDGVDVVNVGIVEIPEKIVFSTPIGHRSPGYATAAGKAMLSCQPVEMWDRLISRIEFVRYTDRTIVDPQQFREELVRTRDRGYGIQDGELIANLSSIAAPIIDFHGDIAGAIQISGFSMQIMNEDKKDTYIHEVVKAARVISTEFGHMP